MKDLKQYLWYLNVYKKAYSEINEDSKSDIKASMNVVFNMLPDCELVIISPEYESSTLYKRDSKWFDEDDAGEVDPTTYLLQNSGLIHTKEEANILLASQNTTHKL